MLCAAAGAALLLCGGIPARAAEAQVDCGPLPDAKDTLAAAWQDYKPDQEWPFSIPVRSHLFAFQSLLISAGMYDEPPSDPVAVYASYAPRFVRDFGMGRNPPLQDALAKLSQSLLDARDQSEADLGENCGLILARRMLRDDAVGVSSDWVLQAVTWGFAPMFQESIRQIVRQDAEACAAEPDASGVPESVLVCTMRKVGL
jgi:hypothetical protein